MQIDIGKSRTPVLVENFAYSILSMLFGGNNMKYTESWMKKDNSDWFP